MPTISVPLVQDAIDIVSATWSGVQGGDCTGVAVLNGATGLGLSGTNIDITFHFGLPDGAEIDAATLGLTVTSSADPGTQVTFNGTLIDPNGSFIEPFTLAGGWGGEFIIALEGNGDLTGKTGTLTISSLVANITYHVPSTFTALGVIRHRFTASSPNDPDVEISSDAINDSFIVQGGIDGFMMVRDSTQNDGWGLLDPFSLVTDLTKATGVLPTLSIPTFTGDITNAADILTIGPSKVLASMLAGVIPASKLIGTDITLTESQIAGLTVDLALRAPLISPAFTGVPTAPTATAGTNTTQIATTAFAQAAVASVVGFSPATLDTLNKLALAIGSDPNFATTITTLIATKAPIISPALTGIPTVPTAAPGTNSLQIASTAFVLANAGASSDATLTFTDILTNNASITKHGFTPKLPNDATKFLNGLGAWAIPAGGGGGVDLATATGSLPESQVTSLVADLALKAALASPALTGVPTAPTATVGTNTTQLATTAFVLANAGGGGSDATLTFTDITTNNVSITKHGFVAKLPNDSSRYLNGIGAYSVPAVSLHAATHAAGGSDQITITEGQVTSLLADLAAKASNSSVGVSIANEVTARNAAIAAITDATLPTSDVTTNDVSTTKHGFTPKAPNDATKFLNGLGAWAVPAGGGGGVDLTTATGTLQAANEPAHTGDVTNTAGSLALAIGAGKVTVTMLAGSITAAKLVQTDIVLTESQVTNLVTDLATKAPLASPAFTGVPTAPTAALSTNTTQIATTAFVLANAGAATDANLSTSDITTNDVSSSKHGFAPKGTGLATQYLDGTGAYSTPAGSTTTQTTTAVGTQTGLNLTGYPVTILRCNNATSLTFQGITTGGAGHEVMLLAIGAGDVTINNDDAGATALKRILTGTGAAITITAGVGWAFIVYDNTTGRWRLAGSSATGSASDATLTTTDITTNNVSTTKHGFAPKAPNDATKFLDGTGVYSVPASGIATPVLQVTTLTGTQNDFTLTAGCTELRCNNATLLTITGMSAGFGGQRIQIISVGAGQVEFVPQAAGTGSVAANRLANFATVGNTPLAAGSGAATYEYDATLSRWRLVTHDQGAWITPAYSAGDYTADTGVWTVEAGDVTLCRYLLRGRTLHLLLHLQTTTTTTGTGLSRVIPGGFAAVVSTYSYVYFAGITGGSQIGLAYVASTSLLTFYRATVTAIGAFTNAVEVAANAIIEVT
jgi:hypothetical protein